MILYYTMELRSMKLRSIELRSISKILFLNLKGLFGGIVVSLTKNEYGSSVHFL